MQRRFGTVTVIGASRGIGSAVAHHLQPRTARLITVSRSLANVGDWISADITSDEGIQSIQGAVGPLPLDALLIMGGTWEQDAFTPEYAFARSGCDEVRRVISTNLAAPILLIQSLLPALQRADNPKVVLLGGLPGRESWPGREVANTASKFGLRGVVHALRHECRARGVGLSLIDPGFVGTPEVMADVKAGRLPEESIVPMSDLLMVIDCVLNLSRASSMREVVLPATLGEG